MTEAKVDKSGFFHEENSAELDALLPVVLDKAFKGVI